MFEIVTLITVGGLFLFYGGDFLVKGASSYALRKGVSLLVVGLTVVSMGTSAPELFVSLAAALGGNTAISVGNVIGSNIANVALALGAAALISPVKIRKSTLTFDLPILLASSALLFITVLDGTVGRIDGGIYIFAFILFLYYCFRSRHTNVVDEPQSTLPHKWQDWAFVICGMAGLYFGSDFFVGGAIKLAKMIGVSDFMIGLSVVALGTSLPEVATSVLASIKQEDDISLGNVIGSNIFNILLVLGAVSLIKPLPCETGALTMDLPVMLGVALLIWPLGRKLKIGRGGGALFLCIYIAYIVGIAVRG